MIIKKFQAGTEKDAMSLAVEELGSDVTFMHTKIVKPKGIFRLFKKPVVEVTAAVEESTAYSGEHSAKAPAVKQTYHNPNIIDETLPQTLRDTEESAIEKRLNNLQNLLERQIQAGKDEAEEEDGKEAGEKSAEQSKRITCLQLIYNQLIHNEVDEQYANQLISEIEASLKKDASVDNILGAVYQKIILKLGQPGTIEIEEKKTKFVFFIGPTGVGKTTTIAKIASSLTLSKKAKIALLTSDTYRIAAVEQLRTYANILGVPLKVVYSAEEIKAAREELTDYDLVFVDTAGRSHKSKEQCEDMEVLIRSIPQEEREAYLVLSATTKYIDLIHIAETYAELADYRLIFTKLDETGSIGNIFNIRMLTGAPLSYTTWGQNVPDDIGKIDAQHIAKQLLGGGE